VAGRIVLRLLGVILAAGLTLGQSGQTPAISSAQLLVLPRPGIPISFEQVEEHSRKLGDGTSTVEFTVTGKTYRDSAGRLRIQSETLDGSGHTLASSISLTDPVAGVKVVLLSAEKLAYRTPFAVSSESRFAIDDAADGQQSKHKWKVETENAGRRTIEGIEFEGTQIITTAEDEPNLSTTVEQWYSDKLRLIGDVDRSGPYTTYAIRIQKVHREEPDPALFVIPADYKIISIKLSSP
jgi:hypothetical protein